MTALRRFLRDADWADRTRIRGYLVLLALGQGAALIALAAFARNGVDPRGEPVGTDFVSFWTAGRLALAGDPAAIYSPSAHHAAEQAMFGHPIGWYAFFYPPIFVLACLPLGLLPYLSALALWLASTLAGLIVALRALAPRFVFPLTIAAFPGLFANIGHGQNAFLSAALFAGGAACVERRPVLAGVLFGALSFKPQLALLIPFGLVVTGRWRALAAMAATAVALAGLSFAAFGVETWRAFLAETPLARATLERGLVDPAKLQSVFAAVRVLGGGVATAYLWQGAVAIAALAGLWPALRARGDARLPFALIAIATCLSTPFLLDYDLTLLIVPIAVLFDEAVATGFRPYEKTTLLAAYLLPGFARPFAQYLGLPVAPLVVAALFAVVLRRCLPAPAAESDKICRESAVAA